jgi:membrane associated rhomboid family serine protease/Flp pilus assembly protein TadD
MAKCIQCGRQLPSLTFRNKLCQWCIEHAAQQRGEVAEDAIQRVMPAPWLRAGGGRIVTQGIFGINVAVFLGMALAGVSITDPSTRDLLHWGANSAHLTLAGDWWRLVTSMFLHIGVIHIALNMWCLWSLGGLAESLYGPWMFTAIYFISGVGGSLASIAWHPYGVSAGASGAIFGLAGALIASYYLGEFSLPRPLIAANLRCVVAFAGYNLVFGAMSGTTDNAAHVGGLAAGALMGAMVAWFAADRDAFLKRLGTVAVGTTTILAAGFWLAQTRGLDARVSHAEELLGENKSAQAIAELQKITRWHSGFAPAHFALAHAYYDLEQYDQAEKELKRVLEIQPQHPWARYQLGMSLLHEGRAPEAQHLFSDRIATNANDAEAHYGLAVVLADEENAPAAIQEYMRAAQLAPEMEGVEYEIGNLYVKLKRYDDAIAAFEKERGKNGDDQYIETGLANAYKAKGMTAESQAAQSKAEQLKKTEDLD